MKQGQPAGAEKHVLKLECDSAPLMTALASLEELAEVFPEIVKSFLDGLHSGSELCRVDVDKGAASATGDVGIVFKPSDRLVVFVSALRARKVD